MKFIHKISKITSYIIQICLLIFILASNSLWGEVYRTGKPVRNAAEFEQLIREHTELKQHYEEKSPKRTAKLEIKKLFERIKAFQMFGCGVFIPKSTPGTFYLAQKHAGPSTTIHNPTLGGHPFNINLKDHTERQLATYLAKEARRSFKSEKDIIGEFHIYTTEAPCMDAIPDNNNFSCIEYYKVLHTMFPNCTFHIYFSEITLNSMFFTNKGNAKYWDKLIESISDGSTVNLKEKPEEINNWILQYKKGKKTKERGFIDEWLNIYLTPAEKTAILKKVHPIERFTYHLVSQEPTEEVIYIDKKGRKIQKKNKTDIDKKK